MIFFVWLVSWLSCAVVTAIIASSRNRSSGGWFLIGLALGIFGLVLVIALPAAVHPTKPIAEFHPLIGAGRRLDASKVDCPDCGEPIEAVAFRCPYCGTRIR